MTGEKRTTDDTSAVADDIPEQDFSRAIRPNRFANLRGVYRYAVFLDPALFAHFGSEEKVVDALRLLVELADRQAGSLRDST